MEVYHEGILCAAQMQADPLCVLASQAHSAEA